MCTNVVMEKNLSEALPMSIHNNFIEKKIKKNQ